MIMPTDIKSVSQTAGDVEAKAAAEDCSALLSIQLRSGLLEASNASDTRAASPGATISITSTITADSDAEDSLREATGKRKRRVSKEEDEEDISPSEDVRIMAIAHQNNMIRCNHWGQVSPLSPTSTVDYEQLAHFYLPMPTQTRRSSVDNKTQDVSSLNNAQMNLPSILHAMLSTEQYSHILSWMPHGRAWKVHSTKLLVDEAPLGLTSYSMFTKQLSEWGFKKLHQVGPDFGSYYHECFLRGFPELTNLMRKTVEPNFYGAPPPKRRPVTKEDNKKVLLLADVALQYGEVSTSGTSDNGATKKGKCSSQSQDEPLAKPTIIPLNWQQPQYRRKNLKKASKRKVLKLEDLPPQSKDDPIIILSRLNTLMERTRVTQKRLQRYDKKNGLPRSHAQTMLKTSRSRTKCQEVLKRLD